MIHWSSKSKGSRRRGAALVEFALVAPILIVLMLGIVEFAWFAKNQLSVSNAAREGARIASLGKSKNEIRERVRNSASPIEIPQVQLEYSEDSGNTYAPFPDDDTVRSQNTVPVGSLIRVTVYAVHNPLTSLSLFGHEIRVPVTMVRERT
jgi:Flp pilus assembly protein TadG